MAGTIKNDKEADMMPDMEQDYKLQLDKLRKLIRSPKNFASAIELALEIHAVTHAGMVSSSPRPTFYDELLDGLTDEDYHIMPTEKDETIAWQIWHIARIEDLVGNLLIAEQDQVFNDEWMSRLNVTVRDTGNAMTDEQIIDFSRQVSKRELIEYRNTVGCRTREILKSLTPGDLKRKPGAGYLDRLISEGGLLNHKKSLWLRDFWGNYTVTGLILLPLTLHHMLHLPDSAAIRDTLKSSL